MIGRRLSVPVGACRVLRRFNRGHTDGGRGTRLIAAFPAKTPTRRPFTFRNKRVGSSSARISSGDRFRRRRSGANGRSKGPSGVGRHGPSASGSGPAWSCSPLVNRQRGKFPRHVMRMHSFTWGPVSKRLPGAGPRPGPPARLVRQDESGDRPRPTGNVCACLGWGHPDECRALPERTTGQLSPRSTPLGLLRRAAASRSRRVRPATAPG
jgi:hypothetical protein